MVDPTPLIPEFETLVQLIQPLVIKLSFLVGGVFGLYFILILVRVYFEHKKVKLLKHIRFDLDQLNMHYNLPYSKKQKGWIKRTWNKILRK